MFAPSSTFRASGVAFRLGHSLYRPRDYFHNQADADIDIQRQTDTLASADSRMPYRVGIPLPTDRLTFKAVSPAKSRSFPVIAEQTSLHASSSFAPFVLHVNHAWKMTCISTTPNVRCSKRTPQNSGEKLDKNIPSKKWRTLNRSLTSSSTWRPCSSLVRCCMLSGTASQGA